MVIAAEELEKLSLKVNPDDDTFLKRPTRDTNSGATFKSTQDTKNINLVEGDSSKQAVIGANMDLHRKACSSSSSMRIATSSHGNLLT